MRWRNTCSWVESTSQTTEVHHSPKSFKADIKSSEMMDNYLSLHQGWKNRKRGAWA